MSQPSDPRLDAALQAIHNLTDGQCRDVLAYLSGYAPEQTAAAIGHVTAAHAAAGVDVHQAYPEGLHSHPWQHGQRGECMHCSAPIVFDADESAPGGRYPGWYHVGGER